MIECPGVFTYIVPELASLQSLQQLELVDPRSLIWLSGKYVYIRKPCGDFLQQLTSLTHLKLGGRFSDANGVTAQRHSVGQSVWALKQLRSVEIDCGLGTMCPHTIQGLSDMAQLSSLCLRASGLCVMSTDQSSDRLSGKDKSQSQGSPRSRN